MTLPTIPSTHRWIDGGAVVRYVGNSVIGAGKDAVVFCWDRDTDAAVTDLYDQYGNHVDRLPVVDNTFIAAVPKTVAKPAFSVGVTGARFAGNDWEAVANAKAAADSASSSASSAASSAALVGAPAKSAMDAAMGGDVAGLVPKATGKVDKGALVYNVKDYGAVGDGTADDTTAIQSAIDAAYTAKAEVFVPPGTYKITTALLIPASLRMRGANAVTDIYSSIGKASRIDSYGPEAFKVNPSTPGAPTVYVSLSDLFISNKVSTRTGTAFIRGTTLRGSRLERVTVDSFGTMFAGPAGQPCMNFVTVVRACSFMGIWEAFNSGAIMDTTIESNYINGYSGATATCFDVNGWAQVTISGNYTDYFKYIFKLSGSHSTISVVGNRFDVAYRAVWSSTSPRALDRASFVANTFRFMRAADVSKFAAPDTDMSTGSWVAVEVNGATNVTFVGNIFDRVDTAFKFRAYPHLDLKVKANTYQQVTTLVDWSVTKSATTGDLTGIDIDPMHDSRVTTLPAAALSGGSVASFDKQRLIYSGVPVFNDNGTWRKYDGTVAT